MEIKPGEQRDEAGCICGHIKQTNCMGYVLSSFKHMLRSRVDKAKSDCNGNAHTELEDYEIVLGDEGKLVDCERNGAACIMHST